MIPKDITILYILYICISPFFKKGKNVTDFLLKLIEPTPPPPPPPPTLKVQSLNHWTTREVPTTEVFPYLYTLYLHRDNH